MYIYHITYRYIDSSCHNFENCLPPWFFSQSCLGRQWLLSRLKIPERHIMEGDNFQNKCSMIQCIYMYRVVYDTSLEAARTFDQLTIWTWNWHTQLSWPWTKLCWATKWTNWDILYYFLSTISHFFCKYYTSMQVSYFVLQSHENWSITNEKQSTITSLWLNQCVNTTYIPTIN